MSYQRVQDVVSKKSGRNINVFRGYHGGYGKTDQPDEYAWVCDLDFRFRKPALREGMKKSSTSGKTADIDGLFHIFLNGKHSIGIVTNGAVDVTDCATFLG